MSKEEFTAFAEKYMEYIVSDKHILLINREGKTDIIPVPAVSGVFVVFFLAVFFISRV